MRLLGLFPEAGPFIGRNLFVDTRGVRLGGSSVTLGGPLGLGGPVVPRASYQWLLFEELDGGQPAGAQTFEFRGPNIPFVGAITEVDLFTNSDVGEWQIQMSVEGLGSIFKSSQSGEILSEEGFFRVLPAGFWPETEGLTFPIPSSGARPLIRFRRETSKEKNIVVRVLIVAHPA